MQIDRSNYEIWLIDWLDGNLSDAQVVQLKHFLAENADIKEEFDEMNGFRDAMHGISTSTGYSNESFLHKERLKKATSNLSESQFEYLCIASLENDLSADQQAELNEIIEHDREKKTTLELFQKARLIPGDIRFRHKKRLIRRTLTENILRISIIGLSAAAITTILVLNDVSKPVLKPLNSEITALNSGNDPVSGGPNSTKVTEKFTPEQKPSGIQNAGKVVPVSSKQAYTKSAVSGFNPQTETESFSGSIDSNRIIIDKVPVKYGMELNKKVLPNTLIALSITTTHPEADDERSRLSRFIAKTFREKILKVKSARDSPLKAYEIAEAGVSGLNKLFGWEMALDERKDQNGELKSVYFSSKILKFNAPLKKTETLQ
jgi:hypothetical protein